MLYGQGGLAGEKIISPQKKLKEDRVHSRRITQKLKGIH